MVEPALQQPAEPLQGITVAPRPQDLELGFSYKPILLDFGVRCVVLIAWLGNMISSEAFYLLQVVGIGLGVFGYTLIRRKRVLKGHGVPEDIPSDEEPVSWGTGLSRLVALTFVLLGSYVVFETTDRPLWLRATCSVATLLVYGFYIWVLYLASPQEKRILERGMQHSDSEAGAAMLATDKNDREITHIEVELSSITHRADAYVIESALFGALAFSAFVQVLPSGTGLSDLAVSVARMDAALTWENALNPDSWIGIRQTLLEPANLSTALLFETLGCAMLFLSVIVSRLRCSDLTEKATYYTHLARSFNTKEEDLSVATWQSQTEQAALLKVRIEQLGGIITDHLASAVVFLDKVKPIVLYMRVFRTLGIASFLLVLITGALLLSRNLASLFFFLALLPYLYSSIHKQLITKKIRHLFPRRGKGFHRRASGG